MKQQSVGNLEGVRRTNDAPSRLPFGTEYEEVCEITSHAQASVTSFNPCKVVSLIHFTTGAHCIGITRARKCDATVLRKTHKCRNA
ncbi:uncharacterized protein LOC144756318 isoform X2 [Lissotriton helveticus]